MLGLIINFPKLFFFYEYVFSFFLFLCSHLTRFLKPLIVNSILILIFLTPRCHYINYFLHYPLQNLISMKKIQSLHLMTKNQVNVTFIHIFLIHFLLSTFQVAQKELIL